MECVDAIREILPNWQLVGAYQTWSWQDSYWEFGWWERGAGAVRSSLRMKSQPTYSTTTFPLHQSYSLTLVYRELIPAQSSKVLFCSTRRTFTAGCLLSRLPFVGRHLSHRRRIESLPHRFHLYHRADFGHLVDTCHS